MKSQTFADFSRLLFDNMVDGLAYCQMIFDKEGNPSDFVYIRTNKNFEKLTGLKKVIGEKATDITPGIKTSNPELFEIFGQVALSGKQKIFETYIKSLAKWFSISVYSHKKNFFVAIFQNITERKSTEKNLEDAKIAARNVLEDLSVEKSQIEIAKAKNEATLASIGDGLVVTDAEGKIILVNKIFEKILGWKESEVKGKLLTEIILATDEDGKSILSTERPVMRTLAGSVKNITITHNYKRKDGTFLPVAVTVAPILVEGKIIGVVEVFRDITREKEIEKAKDEFVSLASHQLRTPSAAINWYTEMLLEEEVGVLNKKQKEYLKEIFHSNHRMIDLVNMLLSVSRIELGTFTFKPEPVNIAAMVDDVLEELQNQIDEKRLKIEKSYEKDFPIVENDEKLTRIIFQNLLSNAVAYTPAGGKISIKFRITGADIHIEVGDNGCGIPKAAQPKLYTKFFRADNARALQPDGTGLGLYITKSVVEALGGTINFKSEEGRGTIFSVDISGRNMKKK